MKDPVVDLDRALVSRDREGVPLLPMEPDELPVVERRQDVSIHHDKRALELVHEPERPCRSKRFLLADVSDVDMAVVATVEDSFDQVRQVADTEVDVDDARFIELVADELDNSLASGG